jgi:hypothetical protein
LFEIRRGQVEIAMPVLGKMALAVVAGGIALGTMLGAAANPVMKKPVAESQLAALQAPVAADAAYLTIEAPPQDLSPYQDSYAPTWAREEVTSWEPDYPAWTYSELVDQPAEPPRIEEQPVATAPGGAAPPAVAPLPEPGLAPLY